MSTATAEVLSHNGLKDQPLTADEINDLWWGIARAVNMLEWNSLEREVLCSAWSALDRLRDTVKAEVTA